ncbi:MAG: peptide/nickel transport system substrate-binding protein [Chloroflexia bacterium]|jgi:peptide/nickel transport system substrate-binding protein|nr:peptide/nickel transport system substrate-binding protein [Chloroflexia bacterium]
MNDSKRKFGNLAFTTAVAASLAVSLLPAAASPARAAQGQSRNLGPNNIPVAGRFLEVWNAQGSEANSVYVNGYPITPRRAEISTDDGKVYETQWFERARYEAHPENKAPYDVLLGRLGVTLSEGRGTVDPATKKVRNASDAAFVGIDKPADASATKVWFQETRHSISGKILETWNKYGGLQQFGFPLSEQFQEISATDGKTYTVQYFERNRLELHPEKAAPFDVELGLLGVQQYKLTPIPADQLPFAPPPNVTSTKDTLVQGSLQEPTSLVGVEESTVVAGRFTSAITFGDVSVILDDKQNPVPTVVWYVPTLENGGTYFVGTGGDRHLVTKFKLRRGVKWADGKEVTSSDFVYGYKFTLADPNVVTNQLWKKLSGVDNPDKYTVIYNWLSLNEATAKWNDPKTDKTDYAFLQAFVNLKKPVVDPQYIFIGAVFPEQTLSKLPVDKLQESDYARNPMGFGPYMVQSWKQGEEMVLVENPNYNLTAKPLIKRIISRFQTDVNQNVSQFLTGNLDAIAGEAFVVPPEQCPQIVSAGGKCEAVPAASWEHLEPYFAYAPFADKNVRQAIMQAINRKQIADVVFKGGAAVMNSPVPPTIYYSLDSPDFAKTFPDLAAKYKLPIYNFDQAAANSLLDKAGWVRGADGIRAKGGEKLSFEYGTTRNATRQAIQALVQADLKAVGIDAVTVNYPQGFFAPDGPISTGKTKLAEFAYNQSNYSNFDVYSEDELWTPEDIGKQNRQQYKNKVVTEANRVLSSELDRNKIAEAAAQIQVEMMNDIAVMPLVQRPNIEIFRNTLQNRKVTNSQASQWWNIMQWYFK